MRFRASKGDQLRLGVVVTRVRVGSALAFRDGGGAVALMTELMSGSDSYPPDAPMMTYGVRDSGSLLVWNRYDAVAALRQVVGLAGLPPAEFALHSLRIGGATHLSAAGVSPEVLQKEGRWKSDAFKSYVRANDANCALVSEVMADKRRGGSRQPGQDTEWRGK